LRPSDRHRLALLLLAAALAASCRVMPGSSPTGTQPAGSPPQSPAADAAEAFLDAFTVDPPPYRVTLEVEIGGVSEGSALIEAEVRGADYRASVHVALGGLPPRDSEIVFVDGTGYLREAGDDQWVVVPGYRSTPPLNPFLVLAPSDYADAGPDPERGGVRHLSSARWVEADATLGYEDGGVEGVRFDVWVDGNGRPVEATLGFAVSGTDHSGQAVELTYSARYTFRDVGAPVTIQPPVAAPTS
jgi:hypothetical protein